jgi:hypothetical protein
MGLDEDKQRLTAASHAMQSGVASKMEIDPAETTGKHLRVGVNSALVSHSALVRLLVAKGVITLEEYFAAAADAMEDEKRLYERELSAHFSTNITLH